MFPAKREIAESFSPNDPIFVNIPTISGDKIVSASTANTPLETLASWFREHRHTPEFVYFYVCPPQMAIELREKRVVAIKSQILKGVDLVMRLEACSAKANEVFEKSDHPFPQLKTLQRARELWQKVCANDFVSFGLRKKINIIVERRAVGLKMLTAALLSLLASTGAMPENYIPIIQFEKLDLSEELIASKDSTCQVLQQRTVCYQLLNMAMYKELSEIESRYAVSQDQPKHIEEFAAMIDRFKSSYDPVNKCMKASCDSTEFLDFLLHPNCLVAREVRNFLTTKTTASYGKLINDLIAMYEVQRDLDLLIALFSNSIVTKLSPLPVEFVVCDLVFLEQLFELYVEHDPIRFLVILTELLSKGDTTRLLKCVADGFNSFSGNWRSIFSFVVNFSLEDFLTDNLQTTRQLLVEFLASHQ